MQRGGANLVDVSLDICDTVIVESRAVKLMGMPNEVNIKGREKESRGR